MPESGDLVLPHVTCSAVPQVEVPARPRQGWLRGECWPADMPCAVSKQALPRTAAWHLLSEKQRANNHTKAEQETDRLQARGPTH